MSTATEIEKKQSQAYLDCWHELNKYHFDIGADVERAFISGWMASFDRYVLAKESGMNK